MQHRLGAVLAAVAVGASVGVAPIVAAPAGAAVVTSTTPAGGPNSNGALAVTAQGTFRGVTKVALTRTGYPDVVGTGTTASASSVTSTFDLRGRAPGSWSFVVTDADGASPARTFSIFGASPSITSISPDSARAGTNPTVTISGTGLYEGAQLTVGPEPELLAERDVNQVGTVTDKAEYALDGTWVKVDLAIAGGADTSAEVNPRDITLRNADGQTTSKAKAFSVTPKPGDPVVTNVSQGTLGQGAVDVPLTITGTELQQKPVVTFERGGATDSSITTKVTEVSGCTRTNEGCSTIKVLVSVARSAPTGDDRFVRVAHADGTNNNGQVNPLPPRVAVVAGPDITGLTRTGGVNTDGAAQLEVTGTFPNQASTVLQLVRTQASKVIDVTGLTFTAATATAPAKLAGKADLRGAPAGAYQVVATNSTADKGRDVADSSYLITGPPPTITSVSPARAVVGRSTRLTITGTGFAPGTTVSASGSGISLTGLVVASATSMSVDANVDPGAATGARSITATAPDGQAATCGGCLTLLPKAVTSFTPYGTGWKGGVAVATGNVDPSTPAAEIVTAAGPGGGPHVLVHSVAPDGTRKVLASFFAYAEAFRGGVFVAAGDVDGDGDDEVITAPGRGGGPNVKVWSVNAGTGAVALLHSFNAYDPRFEGGVSVAFGRVDPTVSAPQILTGAGAGAGPHVRSFAVLPSGVQPLGGGFFAYDPNFRGGVNVASGDMDADGTSDWITVPQAAGPHVEVFRGTASGPQLAAGYFAVEQSFTGGLTVAAGKVLASANREQVVVGTGPGRANLVRLFTGLTSTPAADLVPVVGTGGMSVAAGDLEIIQGEGSAVEEVVAADLTGGGRVFIVRA